MPANAQVLVKLDPRNILVIWYDADGREQRESRRVYFEIGFGPHIRWNRHTIPVGAMDTEIRLDIPGPKVRNKGR